MQIGFFVQGQGAHWDIAKYLIASARKVMPKVPIVQLTDGDTPAHEGISRIVRETREMPMAVRRMTLHASLPGDWLFVDTDVVIQKDVSHVFEDDGFDIALTDRRGSIWENTPYGRAMPYNMGVTFSRTPAFWEDVCERLKTLPAPFQEWEGDQRVVCLLAEDWVCKILPGHVYNFTPAKQTDDRSHAAIVHYKGSRKEWIKD